jgi:hypothetical protein
MSSLVFTTDKHHMFTEGTRTMGRITSRLHTQGFFFDEKTLD